MHSYFNTPLLQLESLCSGNGFQQLWINYTNEKLQELFVARILKDERAWYQEEGIEVQEEEFFDNKCVFVNIRK